MSPGGRAEGMARLRRVIAEIEAEAGPAGGAPAGGLPARRLPLARAFEFCAERRPRRRRPA